MVRHCKKTGVGYIYSYDILFNSIVFSDTSEFIFFVFSTDVICKTKWKNKYKMESKLLNKWKKYYIILKSP